MTPTDWCASFIVSRAPWLGKVHLGLPHSTISPSRLKTKRVIAEFPIQCECILRSYSTPLICCQGSRRGNGRSKVMMQFWAEMSNRQNIQDELYDFRRLFQRTDNVLKASNPGLQRIFSSLMFKSLLDAVILFHTVIEEIVWRRYSWFGNHKVVVQPYACGRRTADCPLQVLVIYST